MVVLGGGAVSYERGTPVLASNNMNRPQGDPIPLGVALPYRGTSLIRNRLLLGLYSSPLPRGLGWS